MARLAKIAALVLAMLGAAAPRANALWSKFYGNVSVNGLTNAGDTSLQGQLTVGATAQFSGPVRASSWSVVNVSGSFNHASFSVCDSTVSIVPVGSTVTIKGDGSVSSLLERLGAGVLQNGAYILGESSSLTIAASVASAAGYNVPMNFERVITGLTPGTAYNFCIGFTNDGGGAVTVPGSLASNYQFSVRETTLK